MHNLTQALALMRAVLLGLSVLLSTEATATQTCNFAVVPSTPSSDFTVHEDGTVTHHKTGLMWMRDTLPSGVYTWDQALAEAESAVFAGYSDWRLPNVKELASIVETSCNDPTINLSIFSPIEDYDPTWQYLGFWSSSPAAGYAGWSDMSFGISFAGGEILPGYRGDRYQIRLVRGGQ